MLRICRISTHKMLRAPNGTVRDDGDNYITNVQNDQRSAAPELCHHDIKFTPIITKFLLLPYYNDVELNTDVFLMQSTSFLHLGLFSFSKSKTFS